MTRQKMWSFWEENGLKIWINNVQIKKYKSLIHEKNSYWLGSDKIHAN